MNQWEYFKLCSDTSARSWMYLTNKEVQDSVSTAIRAAKKSGADNSDIAGMAVRIAEKRRNRQALRDSVREWDEDYITSPRHYYYTMVSRAEFRASGHSDRIYLRYGGPDFQKRWREIKTEINSQSDDIVDVLHAVLEELHDRMNVIETCDCEWCERYARYNSAITRLIVGISRARTARDKAMETKVDIEGMGFSRYSFDQGVYCGLDTCLQMIEGLL